MSLQLLFVAFQHARQVLGIMSISNDLVLFLLYLPHCTMSHVQLLCQVVYMPLQRLNLLNVILLFGLEILNCSLHSRNVLVQLLHLCVQLLVLL